MVRYHLPFATLRETQYRMISMYLLAQYFLYRRGKEPDLELKNLVKVYDDIRIVNKSFFQRLAHIKIKDATLNALVKLDMFAQHVSFSIDRNVLDEMEYLFLCVFSVRDPIFCEKIKVSRDQNPVPSIQYKVGRYGSYIIHSWQLL